MTTTVDGHTVALLSLLCILFNNHSFIMIVIKYSLKLAELLFNMVSLFIDLNVVSKRIFVSIMFS